MVYTGSNSAAGLMPRARHDMLQWLLRQERRYDHLTMRFVWLAWTGAIGLPLYYLVWACWFPQGYESLGLRILGAALCLPALYARKPFKGRVQCSYLFVAATYVLPFFFTFMFLMNHGGAVWSQSLLVALIVLFQFPLQWAVLSYLVGSAAACAAFAHIGDAAFLLSPTVLAQLPVHVFTVLIVPITKVGRRVLAHEKLAGMAQGLATVSHELRTPLISVEANARGINRLLARASGGAAPDSEAMNEAMARIQFEVRHMNHLVDLFLLSATAVNEQLGPSEYVSMHAAVEALIKRYPFAAQAQRDMVAVDVRGDFTFAGRHELCIIVLLNLLRNALKALHRAGKGRVRIIVDGARARPRLLFIDTGCGIEPNQLPLIFQRFYSYPASTGSGIGLALCKEIIEAWQASIRCISRELAYTIFVLEFPANAALSSPAASRFD